MLTQRAFDNPAAVAAAVALILLLGGMSLTRLPIQLFPDLSQPRIAVQTTWRAASPREVEAEIIEPLEGVLQGLPGVERMTAWANPGEGWIDLDFAVGTDMQASLLEVISRMNRLPSLPRDADPPIVMSGGGNQGTPALTYYFVQQLPDNPNPIESYIGYIDDVIRPAIEAVPGVANVTISSGASIEQELRVRFDPYRAANLGVPLTDLAARTATSDDVSGGYVPIGRREYTLRFAGRYTPRDLASLVLDWRDGRPILLGDVATIEVTPRDRQAVVTQNGNPAVSIRIDRTSGSNALATLNGVKAVVDRLNGETLADAGLTMAQSFDASVFIYRAINLVASNIVAGMLLAVGVLWWFLRGLRATIVVACAIPIALFATFLTLDALGRTLNLISLAGLAFAVGMVLDAAIVVLDSIVSHREHGRDVRASALEGTRHVGGALVASTATTVAIFLPVFFLEGIEGQLFGDLALTITIAVGISLVVAVVVVPVTIGFWRNEHLEDVHGAVWDRLTTILMRTTATARRRAAIAAFLITVPIAAALSLLPELDYLPPVKRDAVDTFFSLPPGANWDTIEREIVDVIDERMAPYMRAEKEPALKNYYILTWRGGGGFAARVEDPDRLDELEQIIKDEIIVDLPDFRAYPERVDLFGDYGGGRSVEVLIQSRDDVALLAAAAQGIAALGVALPEAMVRPRPELELAEPELRIVPNDRALGEAGWTRADLGVVVRALGNGLYVGEHFDGTERLDVILRAAAWDDPIRLAATPLATPAGDVVTLGQLATVATTVGPSNLQRVDRRRTVTLSVVPPQDVSLERVLETIERDVEPKILAALPADGGVLYAGSADNLESAVTAMGKSFALALLILLLLMAVLFRSVLDAGLALLTMPLAMVGGVLGLRALNLVTFQPLDLLTMIGFVILLGLVVNNAILLVHETRSHERQGADRDSAVGAALRSRLRPIFMTTATSIFGMLPLALMPGATTVIYRGLATVIVGGMTLSTVFTLLLLPALLRSVGSRTNAAARPAPAARAA